MHIFHFFFGVFRIDLHHVQGSRLGIRQSSFLTNIQECNLWEGGLVSIIVFIGFYNKLLSHVQLFHLKGTAGHRSCRIIIPIGMLRRNSLEGHGTGKGRKRFVQHEHYRGIIRRFHFIHHGQIYTGTGFLGRFKSKDNVFCGYRLSVWEFHIIPEGKCVSQTVVTDLIICGQVRLCLNILVDLQKRGIENIRSIHGVTLTGVIIAFCHIPHGHNQLVLPAAFVPWIFFLLCLFFFGSLRCLYRFAAVSSAWLLSFGTAGSHSHCQNYGHK